MTHRLALLAPDGSTLHVTADGSGPVLILLHGFPLDHRMWEPQLAALAEHYHVIAPDLPGFGGSTLPELFSRGGEALTMSMLAEAVERVRLHLCGDEPVHLCGLSMGGYVALEYWHRYRTRLKSLILANTKPSVDSDEARAGRLAMAKRVLAEGTWAGVQGMLPRLLGPAEIQSPGAVSVAMETMMKSASPQAVAAAQTGMSQRRDFSSTLAEIQVPTLVLTGEHDAIAPPAETQQWAAQIPRAQYECLPGSGHMTPLEVSADFNRSLVRFLSST